MYASSDIDRITKSTLLRIV